jgi:hypothetical protein
MKTNIEESSVITLELTREEALWLKSYLQNGFPNELDSTSAYRELFFNALPSFEKLYKDK